MSAKRSSNGTAAEAVTPAMPASALSCLSASTLRFSKLDVSPSITNEPVRNSSTGSPGPTIDGRTLPQTISVADGKIASVNVTCVASSVIHVFPSRGVEPRSSNRDNPERRHHPVACHAGRPPAIAAASTLRPATHRTVESDGVKSIQNGRFSGPIVGMTILDTRPLCRREAQGRITGIR